MIALLTRFILLLFIFATFTLSILIFSLGKPTDDKWSFLVETTNYEIPIAGILAISACSISFIIAIWISIAVKRRENNATRSVKKIADPDFTKQLKKTNGSLNKALRDAHELIETQRSSLQRLSNEKVETNDAIVQERLLAERQRLARELHDSVSQQLFAASMLLSALTEQQQEESTQKQLVQVEKIVQQAQLEMRALLLHLRPVALKNKSLAEGLEDLILQLQEKVYFNIDYQIEEITLSKAEEDHLFRIAQEALSNTLRHAKASVMELLFIARDELAILRIQDNGLGFDMNGEKTSSYGLRNIAERAVEIGCTYKIVSVPNEGTIVEVKVPLKKEEQVDD